MSAGINKVLLISTPTDMPAYQRLLETAAHWESKSICRTKAPNGLAEAFLIGAKFIGQDPICLVLGDNIFYGEGLNDLMQEAVNQSRMATVFGYTVKDPNATASLNLTKLAKPCPLKKNPNTPKATKP